MKHTKYTHVNSFIYISCAHTPHIYYYQLTCIHFIHTFILSNFRWNENFHLQWNENYDVWGCGEVEEKKFKFIICCIAQINTIDRRKFLSWKIGSEFLVAFTFNIKGYIILMIWFLVFRLESELFWSKE